MAKGHNKKQSSEHSASRNLDAGARLVREHPLFAPLMSRARVTRLANAGVPEHGWAVVYPSGLVACHPTRHGLPEEWAYVIAHALLHLGFEHFRGEADPRAWNAACCVIVARFLEDLKFGRPPEGLRLPAVSDLPNQERALYERFLVEGVPKHLEGLGIGGSVPDLVMADSARPRKTRPIAALLLRHSSREAWSALLARGLQQAVKSAVSVAAGRIAHLGAHESLRSSGVLAREWFLTRYPLLGGIAAHFKIIEDVEVCRRLDVRVAAVDPVLQEIYLNPLAGLDAEETRFVIAHELLHVALRHHSRRLDRDPYLWNVATDYMINDWLIQMRVGRPPGIGFLHDPELRDLSSEEIYARIARDLRRYRKLMTFRGTGVGDLLDSQAPEWWFEGRGLELDEFYRTALARGLVLHEEQKRGFLPAGLVEEIRALIQPPIPWDVKLAHWFDERFQPLERVRTYARPSRRQGSTPDIPRPKYVIHEDIQRGRTFGVVLDTSMSMHPEILGKALGAIASYSLSRDVRMVRLVYVDAAPYDQGYVEAERLLDVVEVQGRGGTRLQPAVDLLEKTEDFPKDAPILVITDGLCDHVKLQRDHAFLLPQGRSLPFSHRGPVFWVR